MRIKSDRPAGGDGVKALAFVALGLFTVVGCALQPAASVSGSSTLLAFAGSNSYALLPASSQMEGDTCTIRYDNNAPGRTVPLQSRSYTTTRNAPLYSPPAGNSICIICSRIVRGADFQITCQLLNIPPPCKLS